MGGQWPFVGRVRELHALADLLHRQDGGGVVLVASAGVGKTRLALEGLNLAEQAGMATARVMATRSARELPFGAFASLLPAVEHGQAGGADDAADLLHRLSVALTARAEGRRLLLLVDDAHLLDDASATLVHQLSTTGSVFILATVRTDEVIPDPIVALWKDELAERVELSGLSAEAVEELLSSALGGRFDPAAAANLAVRCQGNVLFLRELVLGAIEDGALRDDGGIWRLVRPFSPSARLVELIEARLRGLGADERNVLELVSLGEPLGPAEIAALGDPAVVNGLERKGFLSSREHGRRLEFFVAHPLYSDVLRRQLPALRRREIARSLADVVEQTGARRREDTLRLATWQLDGGGARPGLMFAAATIARWRYDFALADRLARAAADAGAGFDAKLLVAQLACLQGRGDEAEELLEALAEEAEGDSQHGLIAVARMDNLGLYMGRVEEGLSVGEEAEEQLDNQDWRDEIIARRAVLLLGTLGPRAAAEVAAPVVDRASGRALVWACHVAAFSFGRLGQLERAFEASRRGFAAHQALSQPLDWYPWMQTFLYTLLLAHAGRLKEAESLAAEQHQLGIAERSREAQAWFAWALTIITTDRGHVQDGARHGREAAALFRELGRPQFAEFCLPYLSIALALGGHTSEARETLAALDAVRGPTFFMGVDPLQARAWTAVAEGDLSAARQLLNEAVTVADRIGDFVGKAEALHSLARLGQAAETAPAIAELAKAVERDFVAARAAHCRALATRDADSLLAVSIDFEGMGSDLLAAEAATDAAVSWRAAGDVRKAAAAERRAEALTQLIQGATTPALQAVGFRASLTRVERETAILAASGRSSKDIADSLFVSVRTIEGRLLRIYQKLGISSRAELAEILAADNPKPGWDKGR